MDDLQKEWNKILKEEGLPNIRGSKEVPVGINKQGQSTMQVLQNLNGGSREDMENFLEKFEILSAEAQKNIFADLEVVKNSGIPPEEILKRFESLVSKIKDMEDVTIVTNSDNKAPKPPAKTDKEAEDFARGRVEKMFDRMQRIIEEREKKDKEERKDTIN